MCSLLKDIQKRKWVRVDRLKITINHHRYALDKGILNNECYVQKVGMLTEKW